PSHFSCLSLHDALPISSFLSHVRSPRTRSAKRLRWIALVVLSYTIMGFFIAPAVIKSQLIKRLPGLTHRQVAVQQVKLNPYALSDRKSTRLNSSHLGIS